MRNVELFSSKEPLAQNIHLFEELSWFAQPLPVPVAKGALILPAYRGVLDMDYLLFSYGLFHIEFIEI